MQVSKVINGITVTVESDAGDGTTWCHLSRGNHSCSLELAQDYGGIIDIDDNLVVVRITNFDSILNFAYANGY